MAEQNGLHQEIITFNDLDYKPSTYTNTGNL